MKISSSLFWFLLASLILFGNIAAGQNTFIENSFPVKSTTHATAIPGGWVMPMNSNDCSRSWILKYNNITGNYTKFAEPDSSGPPLFLIDDIVKTNSGAFICAGMSGLGADVTTAIHPYIYKMDSSGKIIWQNMITNSSDRSAAWNNPLKKIVLSPDGAIYGITERGNYIAKIDSNGHTIWFRPYNGYNDIAWVSKGLIAAGDSLALLDTGGNIIKVYPASGTNLTGLENGANGSFYAKNDNNIYTLDSTFQVKDSFRFNGYDTSSPNTIINYADNSGYYFARGNSIKAFDLKGNLKWTNYLPTDCNVSGLTTNNNQLAVTGSTSIAAFVKTYDKNGNTAPINRDVSIVNFKPISVAMHPSQQAYYYSVSCSFNVTLQNNGSETIDSLYLLSWGPLSGSQYSCVDEYLNAFHHLNLAPGDTMTLHASFGRLWEAPPGIPYPLSVLMCTTAPNGKLDVNPSNDTASYSKTVPGINENIPGNQTVNIYPNPVSSVLHISNNTGLNTNISVSDITGKEIISVPDPKTEYDFDVSGLPSGIYFVKAWNKAGMQITRLVKE